MIFKSTAYRLGFGKNINSKRMTDGKFLVLYRSRDNVVRSKIIERRAGGVDLKKGDTEFNASMALMINDGFVLLRRGNEVKSIKI